jgi:hypothetical protein
MSLISSATRTIGTSLAAVDTAANSIARSIGTLASTLDMADLWIQDMKHDQILASEYRREHAEELAFRKAVVEINKDRVAMAREIALDPQLADAIASSEKEFAEIRQRISEKLKRA